MAERHIVKMVKKGRVSHVAERVRGDLVAHERLLFFPLKINCVCK